MKDRMEIITSKHVKENIANVLNSIETEKKRYTITRYGKNVGVIIPIEEWKAIEWLLSKIPFR